MFTKLVEYLKDNKMKHTIDDHHFKIDFEAERLLDESDEDKSNQKKKEFKFAKAPQIVEKAWGRIKILKVNASTICIDFSRRKGSSWLFYEKFNLI